MLPDFRGDSFSSAQGNRIQGPPGLIAQLEQLQKPAAPGGQGLEGTGYLPQHVAQPGTKPAMVSGSADPTLMSPSPAFCCGSQKAQEVHLEEAPACVQGQCLSFLLNTRGDI